jgi:phosphate transport system permease protein
MTSTLELTQPLGPFGEGPLPYDPTSPLKPTGNLRRRRLVSRLIVVASTASAALAVAALTLITVDVVKQGVKTLSFNFLTTAPQGIAGGGIAPEIVGTAAIVVGATLLAVPLGVLTAIYLTEFAGPGSRWARALRVMLDMMQGLPTIVIGLLMFGLFVNHHGDVGYAGSAALAVVMLPLIARGSQEQLLLVPNALREAADALGVARWRSILTVVLPSAVGGIVTATLLAMARAAGELAPLLLVLDIFDPSKLTINLFGQGVPNLPVYILTSFEVGSPASIDRAWGAALVLFGMILIANVGARMFLARHRKKMGL